MKCQARFFDVIEACYRLDREVGPWLTEVTEAGCAVVGMSLGLAALVYEGDHHGVVERMRFAGGCDPRWAARFLARVAREHLEDGARGDIARASKYVHCACVSAARPAAMLGGTRSLKPFLGALAEWGGAKDMLIVQGFDPSGAGVWFGAARKRRAALSDAMAVRCAHVATHLAIGWRARRLVAGRPLATAEAVSSPDGRLLHAEAPAKTEEVRATLRRAVLALDRARLSRTPDDEASATRTGLVDARWSLLDDFDTDGRRFVVAVRNDAHLPPHDVLTPRECQVVAHAAMGHRNKEVAYDLGLSDATVRVLMHRAAKKLGVVGRRAAIACFLARSKEHG